MGALIMIIHSDHFIVHFRECGLGMCWALCQIPYKKQSTEKRVDKKKTTNYTHPNLCISVICCSNRRKHELKDNKKNGLWNRKK